MGKSLVSCFFWDTVWNDMPDDKLRRTVDFTQAYLTNDARAYVLCALSDSCCAFDVCRQIRMMNADRFQFYWQRFPAIGLLGMYVSLTEIFVVMRKLGTFVARRLIVKSFHYRPASSSVLNMTLSAFAEANQPHAVASARRTPNRYIES